MISILRYDDNMKWHRCCYSTTYLQTVHHNKFGGGANSRDAVVDLLYCDIIVRKFELQSRYYVHFQKGMNPFIPCCSLDGFIIKSERWSFYRTLYFWYARVFMANFNLQKVHDRKKKVLGKWGSRHNKEECYCQDLRELSGRSKNELFFVFLLFCCCCCCFAYFTFDNRYY